MKQSRIKNKQKMSITEILLRAFFGFIIPYLLINGIIFFIFIQTPKISILGQDSKDYEEDKVKFTINCLLPLIDVKTYYENTEIAYTKLGNTYIINIENNGSYQIKVTALNRSSANSIIDIETQDDKAPVVDVNSAVITGNTLIISVYDDQSNINYDKLYATLEGGEQIKPSYVDRASGTVQFQVTSGEKITIHIEDESGNHSETVFNIS